MCTLSNLPTVLPSAAPTRPLCNALAVMRLLSLLVPEGFVLLVCLCRACSAFVLAARRFPCSTSSSAASTAWSATRITARTPTGAVAPARPRRRSWKKNSCGENAGDEETSAAASGVAGAGNFENSTAAAPEDDPFRPERASVSPMVINALVSVLFKQDTEAVDAAAAMLEQRSKNSDWRLTEEEERAVTDRLCGVADNLTELRFMLATAVERTPWIAKYGMLSDYGISNDVEDEPLAQINQAECLLALYMLHKEGSGVEAVDFLDAEKLEVLQRRG